MPHRVHRIQSPAGSQGLLHLLSPAPGPAGQLDAVNDNRWMKLFAELKFQPGEISNNRGQEIRFSKIRDVLETRAARAGHVPSDRRDDEHVKVNISVYLQVSLPVSVNISVCLQVSLPVNIYVCLPVLASLYLPVGVHSCLNAFYVFFIFSLPCTNVRLLCPVTKSCNPVFLTSILSFERCV